MSKKTKGTYHFAIRALESRLGKIKKNPSKFKNAMYRVRDIEGALEVLRVNNLPIREVAPKPEYFTGG